MLLFLWGKRPPTGKVYARRRSSLSASLEAIYYRKPVIVDRYSIYIVDIEPKGFDVIAIEGFVTNETIERVFEVLNNDQRREEMVEGNYQVGNRHFSYEVLERLLLHLINVLEIQYAVG